MSVLILFRFWNICVDLALYGLLVTRVLKCFVTPTLTYTAQVDDSVLHICIEAQQVIDYMCLTCFVTTVLILTRFWNICVELALYGLLVTRVLKCFVATTLTYAGQVDESVLHVCFDTHQILEYMC